MATEAIVSGLGGIRESISSLIRMCAKTNKPVASSKLRAAWISCR